MVTFFSKFKYCCEFIRFDSQAFPQMFRYLITISLILFSCEQPDLQQTTAAALQELYQQEKGQNAVMLNFWATW